MLRQAWQAALAVSLLLVGGVARADVYALGSSYSHDAQPWGLDGRPQWHIDCGRPLQYIFDNPLAPCELTSTIWPLAFALNQFDYVSFQPVAGEGVTQQSDIDTISFWLTLQPNAVVVIHPTWPLPEQWEEVFHDAEPDNTFTNYSELYGPDLIQKLREANPNRIIVSDRINEIFDSIYHDIENGTGPLVHFEVLFRDGGAHLGVFGQYIAHNALRRAFGQRTSVDNSAVPLPRRVRRYFDAKIRATIRETSGIESGGYEAPAPRLDLRGTR